MTTVLDDSLRGALRKADPVRLLGDLVRAPSHPGVERQEERVAQLLAEYLRPCGLDVELQEVRPGRPNLLARLAGRGGGRSLLLCGHTDTVPPNALMSIEPFAAQIRDGRLQGRGACDMKGALAAMAVALAVLARSGPKLAGDLTLAAVIDEETQSLGAEAVVQSGLRAEGCVVGEPTENRVAIGHRGLELLQVEFTGRAAHGGAPDEGLNAIAAAARFVQLIEDELAPALARRTHALLGASTVNVGVIHGGDQPNTVAARCIVQLERRWIVGETVERMNAEMEALLERVRDERAGVSTRLRRVPGSMATLAHGPLETPPEHPLVGCSLAARAEVCGRSEAPGAFAAWTDAALLWREAGIPCVVMGPGSLAQAHTADEWISIEQVREAACQYVALALRFCGAPDPGSV
ncbi:MAG: M20 family metallopeptidase [Acidobacteriota bacterium]